MTPPKYVSPDVPFGAVIFCDEIRTEDNGKLLLIGAYSDQMIFQAPFPQKLASFAVFITYVEPLSIRPGNVVLKLNLQDSSGVKTLISAEIPARPDPTPDQMPKLLAGISSLRIPVALGELIFTSAGNMQVIAERDGQEFLLGMLPFTVREGVASDIH